MIQRMVLLKVRRVLLAACGVLVITALATVAYGASLNPVTDFPMAQGQNSYWAMAYNPASQVFRQLPIFNNIPGVFASTDQAQVPQVVKNSSGVVKLHPMVTGAVHGTEWAVLQYRAPSTGTYTFNVQFFSATGMSTPCSTRALVFLDSNSANPYMDMQVVDGTQSPTFVSTLQLQKDQWLNFAVDANGVATGDSTGLRSLAAPLAVPEPASVMVFSSGIMSALVAGLRRRKASR